METQKKNRLESHSSTRHHHRHHHLPQEIVEQIMIKLPTKSILRFKCVSKSWRSLASSDRFIKAHLEKSSSKHESLERHHITFSNFRRHTKKKKCPLHSLMYGHDNALVDFNYPTCAPGDSATIIVGTCNGLLCLLKNMRDFILWNPTTRKFRSLPPALDDAELNYLSSGGSHLLVKAYGFCFDEESDYKVFGMWRRSPPLPRDGEQKILAKMYSSKTDSWRRVDDPVLDRVCAFNPTGRFASGNKLLCWAEYRTGDDEGWRIISFDLEKEAFRAVEWPGGLGERNWRLAPAIDGLLCCFSPGSCTRPDHTDYWVLEEGPCWRKFATLGCPRLVEDEIEIDRGTDWFFPLFVGPRDGDILAQHNDSLAVFARQEGGGYSGPKVLDSNYAGFYHTSIYVESLVEP